MNLAKYFDNRAGINHLQRRAARPQRRADSLILPRALTRSDTPEQLVKRRLVRAGK